MAFTDEQQERISLMFHYGVALWSFTIYTKYINQPQFEQLKLPHFSCQLFFLCKQFFSNSLGPPKPWFLTLRSESQLTRRIQSNAYRWQTDSQKVCKLKLKTLNAGKGQGDSKADKRWVNVHRFLLCPPSSLRELDNREVLNWFSKLNVGMCLSISLYKTAIFLFHFNTLSCPLSHLCQCLAFGEVHT